jgi:hypothetical protein
MVRKARPPPLYVSQAIIEREKLEVLKRTERRITEIAPAAEAKANIPQSPRLLTFAFPVLALLLYTAYTFSSQCQCTCAV